MTPSEITTMAVEENSMDVLLLKIKISLVQDQHNEHSVYNCFQPCCLKTLHGNEHVC